MTKYKLKYSRTKMKVLDYYFKGNRKWYNYYLMEDRHSKKYWITPTVYIADLNYLQEVNLKSFIENIRDGI